MEFFDTLSNTISAAGKDGLNKAKELKDTVKLTMDIKEREGSIQRMYRELGKVYYHDHKNDEEPEYDLIRAIKAVFEEIGELKATKDDIRGIKRCPSCGSPVALDANFCSNCGENCESVEEEECEEVEEVPVEEVVEEAAEAEEAPEEAPAE